jgi:hypothetical protein
MAKKLEAFPGEGTGEPRRYPWQEWTDGGVWEIRADEDYDVDTENMRVSLHIKADALGIKVRTTKVRDDQGEGLAFQFFDPDAKEASELLAAASQSEVDTAIDQLYADAMEIYERARAEVMIPRSDGSWQKYAAVRYMQQIERGYEDGLLVPTIAKIIKRPTTGFHHLRAANRPDLMLETLVLDTTKTYHRFFTRNTVETARRRMTEFGYLAPNGA